MLRINGVVRESIVDGPGIRYTIFTQGCSHGCDGCHNPDTHNLIGGKLVQARHVLNNIKHIGNVDKVTFSGGEPFLHAEALAWLAIELKKMDVNIWAFTGYTLEDLIALSVNNKSIEILLRSIDTLVDGPFEKEKKDPDLQFRGSSNQRVLTKEQILKKL